MSEFILPNLGDGVAQGDVLKVLVKPGDAVAVDQPVLELETDKATIEVPSDVAGKVTEVRVKAGDKVKPGQAVLVLDNGAGAAPEAPKQDVKQEAPRQEAPKQEATKQEHEAATPGTAGTAGTSGTPGTPGTAAARIRDQHCGRPPAAGAACSTTGGRAVASHVRAGRSVGASTRARDWR